MRVGIITINDYQNYGNRLQNYAVQEIVKTFGVSAKTIVNRPRVPIASKRKSRFPNIKGKTVSDITNSLYSRMFKMVRKKRIQDCKERRIKAFKRFTAFHIDETNFTISENELPPQISEEYDFFITGSDQVWNPHFRHGSPLDFLTFAPEHKRIAFSCSFGTSVIPEEYVESYKAMLSGLKFLSVRESAGAKIIRDLTGRESVTLVDPTLMLPAEKWKGIAKASPYKPQGNYILTYFLGNQSKRDRDRMRKIARENRLELIHLNDLSNPRMYSADPSEFIDFIGSASLLFTDSFHGAVFSILLETPFVVFSRAGMNSRIETLLSTFKLESRHWDKMNDNTNLLYTDYSHVASILESEREKSYNYLKQALRNGEEMGALYEN